MGLEKRLLRHRVQLHLKADMQWLWNLGNDRRDTARQMTVVGSSLTALRGRCFVLRPDGSFRHESMRG